MLKINWSEDMSQADIAYQTRLIWCYDPSWTDNAITFAFIVIVQSNLSYVTFQRIIEIGSLMTGGC